MSAILSKTWQATFPPQYHSFLAFVSAFLTLWFTTIVAVSRHINSGVVPSACVPLLTLARLRTRGREHTNEHYCCPESFLLLVSQNYYCT